MTSPDVLLDSSVWIAYLRPHGWESLKSEVSAAFSQMRVAISWPIRAELLIGARDDRSFTELLTRLEAVPEVPVTDHLWEDAARLGHAMRTQGLSMPLTDLLIAQCAIEGGLVLWHMDGHFEEIRQRSGLRTRDMRYLDELPEARS